MAQQNIQGQQLKKQKALKLLNKGKLKEAKTILGKICKTNKQDVEARLLMSSACGQLGDMQSLTKYSNEILKLQPNNATAWSNLANAQASLGQQDEALKNYQKALDLKPDDPGILNNLGNAYYIANELELAAETLQKVIELMPDYADAYSNLGNIYKALNNDNMAINYFQRAIKIKPDLFEAHMNLGNILSDRIGHFKSAEEYFRNALNIKPDNITAHIGFINMLRFQGLYEEALDAIQTVLKFHPDNISALSLTAEIYELQGNHDEAYKQARQLVDENKAIVPTFVILLRLCRRYDCCEEIIEKAENVLANKSVPLLSKKDLYFELGKIYDKLKNYEQAFIQYHKGNEIEKPPFDADEFRQKIDDLIDQFSPEKIARLPKSKNDTQRPIFIVGMPRSGTSLTEQILASHPDVAGAGELNDINDIAASLPKLINITKEYPFCIESLTLEAIDKSAQRYLNKINEISQTSRYVTDKMPHNFMHVGLLSLLFPGSRIIHCMRDPRDTCLSIYFQNYAWLHRYSSDLEWLGTYHNEYNRLMQYWKNTLSIPILEFHYEETVNDQEAMTRKLLDFCDLEWNDQCMEFHKSKRHVVTASYDQVRQKMYTQSQARWKNYEPNIQPLLNSLGNSITETD